MEQIYRHFGSDNYAGICPEALESFVKANQHHARAYGEDGWTKQAVRLFQETFETDCMVFFVFNGTAANSLALAHYCQPFESVICHRFSHIETDESGAPGFFGHGLSLVGLDGKNGKISAEEISKICASPEQVHMSKPKMISLTQTTEFGTVYTVAEIQSICEVAKRDHLKIHMDGARFANAIAALKVSPAELTWKSGINVLTFGGSKNGGPLGEAVVFFDKKEAEMFDRRCKQSGQLASKMRFLSAPWVGMLHEENWIKRAAHANSIAAYLEKKIKDGALLKVRYPREANAVFVQMPPDLNTFLHAQGWRFYDWIDPESVRLMTAWDSTEADVDRLIADIELFEKKQ